MKTRLSLIFVLLFISSTFFAFAQNNTMSNTKSAPNEPIFEIKNDAGQTVFAVYPGGVKIFVDDQLKAAGGGFTVGRLSTGKAVGGDILSVNPGNVNVYLDNTTQKAAGGGFTVGRLSTGKAAGDTINFLEVTPDKTHVNIDANSTNGFSVGRIGGVGFDNFLNITPDNYFIGHGVAPEISTGIKNSVLGYFAGHSLSTGSSNILIGDSAGYSLNGNENIFIGNSAGYYTAGPVRNVFIGYYAGYKNVVGQYNTYLGNAAGRNGTGFYNTVLGGLAASTNDFGNSNVVIGYVAGRDMISENNVFIGMGAGYNNSGTDGGNIFIGQYAGEGLADQNNRLAIGTRISGTSSVPLIYGEFDNKLIRINGDLEVTGSYPQTSDKRLKKDFTPLNNILNDLMKINPTYYHWKYKEFKNRRFSDKKQIGVIAQEVEKVFPVLVRTDADGYKSVDYVKFTPILIEAIKEQQKQISNLENRLADLENQNNNLKAQVTDIKNLKSELAELKNMIKNLIPEKEQDKTETAK